MNDFSGHPAEVLLVEDNEADAVLTREALSLAKLRNTLHHVTDGLEALAFLRREEPFASVPRPDFILLDLNMPRMGGREFLGIVKADPEFRSIPVVVLTTSKADQDVLESYDLQANCYVTKPVNFGKFQEIVKQLSEFWFVVARLP